jgi:dienelactone hydrolase
MSNLTFSELLNQAAQLYNDKRYAEALDLVNREFPNFPEQTHRFYFWRACLESLTGQTDQALDTLEESVEAGYWYNQQQLREDSDLDPLQGLPRFEGLVEICLERQVAAQAEAAPSLITLEPRDTSPASGPPWPSLLVLHGNNSNAAAAAEYWGVATSLGWLVALPGSSQVGGPDAYAWNDWEWAKREIQSHQAALRGQHSIDEARVVLGGFSMGGGLAAWLALSGAIQARGFVLVGPWVPDMDELVPLMERGEARRLRDYIIVGEEDEVCREVSLTLAEQLRAHEVPCELEVYPELTHAHPPDFEKGLTRALEFIL